jgi:hypothetical protein
MMALAVSPLLLKINGINLLKNKDFFGKIKKLVVETEQQLFGCYVIYFLEGVLYEVEK